MLIIRRSELYYTASGIITRIGGRSVRGTATYTCDDTRGIKCIKLVNYQDKYTEIYGRQNIKKKIIVSCYFKLTALLFFKIFKICTLASLVLIFLGYSIMI